MIHLNLSAHWCEHHMAFSANISTARQTSEDGIEVTHSRHRTFGPFDSWDDVCDFFMEHLADPSLPPL